MDKQEQVLEPINLAETYTLLHATGDVEKIKGGEQFWSAPRPVQDRVGQLWLLSEHHYKEDWEEWEQHPAGDVLLYLLSGSMDIILDLDRRSKTIRLRSSGAATIPRGVWHTLRVHMPCHVLNLSREFNTKHRKESLVSGL